MKAYVFGGMLVLSAALAACSSSEGDTGAGGGSGGGAGEGGGGDGGSAAGPTSTTGTTTPATTGTTTSTSTGQTGNGICDTGLATNDPASDACLDANCCTEFTACFGSDGSNIDACNACIEAGGGALCDGLNACFAENECGGGGGGVCGTDLGTQDPDLNACIDANCCTEFSACFGEDGSNLDACNACLEAGGGALCDGYLACLSENCGPDGFQVCDSILLLDDEVAAECLGTNCCDETNACFGQDQASFDACVACLEGGGGALCDALIACDTENTCNLLTEG